MSDNIKVAIKSRPLIPREKSDNLVPLWVINDKSISQIDESGNRYGDQYTFDHIFTDSSTNEEVYREVVQYLVQSCMDGFNTTIFTYGQTSSGKTHTMMGSKENTGIIQLAVNDIFSIINNRTDRTYLIRCSYIEIYNEKINDLLEKSNQSLNIREDQTGNTYINAREVIVNTSSGVIDVMKQGNKIRKIGITNMNDRSSRSHTIFRITIESRDPTIENGPLQISQLNLVDLAGSERVAQTKAAGVRLKEGVNINKSLSVLGNVIRQLSEGEGFINYRDSKLTRLLQQALGGNAKALIITTITVATGEETKSSLEFAQRAKLIKNKPEVNVMRSQEAQLKEYKDLIQKYEKRLKNAEDKLKTQKAAWENEIVKLKTEALLIDRFRTGLSEQKSDPDKPKRRHTMGSYGSSVSSDNIFLEPPRYSSEMEVIEEDVYSRKNTYGSLKTILEENLEDALPITPELDSQSDNEHTDFQFVIPAPKIPVQHETSDYQTLKLETENIRSYVNLLEQSYNQLCEFTKKEEGCDDELRKELEKTKNENKCLKKQLSEERKQNFEEKNLIDDSSLQKDIDRLNKELRILQEKNDNMNTDMEYLNKLLKEERLKNEPMRAKFEQDILLLEKEVQVSKQKASEFGFALEQANVEKNLLKISLEREIQDQKFILESKEQKFRNELEFHKKEIDSLNAQNSKNSTEYEKIREELQITKEQLQTTKQKMKSLEDQNDNLIRVCKENEAIVDQYDEKIFYLHDQIAILEKEKDDNELLSKLYSLKEILTKNIPTIQGVATQTESREMLEMEIEKLRFLLASTEIKLNQEIDANMFEKSDHEDILAVYLKRISDVNEELEEKLCVIDDLKKHVNSLESTIEQSNEILNQNMILQKQNDKLNISLSEKSKTIEKLETEISNLEHLNDENKLIVIEKTKMNMEFENKIKVQEMLLEVNNLSLTEKSTIIRELEDKLMNLQNLYDNCNLSLEDKSKIISDYENKINHLEKVNNGNNLIVSQESNTILELQNRLKNLECVNNLYNLDLIEKSKIILQLENQLMNFEEKSDENVDLQNKIKNLENLNQDISLNLAEKSKMIVDLQNNIKKLENINNDKISQLADSNSSLNEKSEVILELHSVVKSLETINNDNKSQLAKKSETILQLQNKMENLESINNETNLLLTDKLKVIVELENKISNLENLNDENTLRLAEKSEIILELENKVKNLEFLNNEINMDLIEKSKIILEMDNAITNSSEKSNEIIDLQNKIKNLENIHHDIRLRLAEKSKVIVELQNNIKSLENVNNRNNIELAEKSDTIIVLQNKIKDLESINTVNNLCLADRSKAILELENKICSLENLNHENNFSLIQNSKIILELQNEIKSLEIQNNENNLKLAEKSKIILELEHQIENFNKKLDGLMELQNRLNDLENVNRTNNLSLGEKSQIILDLQSSVKIFENINKENNSKLAEKDETIIELQNKVKNLENINNKINLNLTDKLKAILELENKIKTIQNVNYEKKSSLTKKEEIIVGLENKINILERINSENNLRLDKKAKIILELENKIKNLEHLNDKNILNLTAKSKTIIQLENKILNLENSYKGDNFSLAEKLTIKLNDLEAKMKESKKLNEHLQDLLDASGVSSKMVEELRIKNKNLLTANESLEKKVKDLEAITKPIADEPSKSMDPRLSPVLLPSSSNLSPRELIKLKRHSIHDQRRFSNVSQESCNGDQIVDQDVNFTREGVKSKKIQELMEKVEHLEMVNRTLNDEVEYFMGENKELKERLASLKDSENCLKIEEFLNKLLNIKKELNLKYMGRVNKEQEIETFISLLEQLCNGMSEGFMKTQRIIDDLEKQVEDKEDSLKCAHLELTGVQDKLKKQLVISKNLKEDNVYLKQQIKVKKQNAEIHIQSLKHKKEEIEKLQSRIQDLELEYEQKIPKDCIKCVENQKIITNWEKVRMEKYRETVELQTKYFDTQNQLDHERQSHVQVRKILNDRIQFLESNVKSANGQKKSVEIQCDLPNVELEGKYTNMKRLANMRKIEIDELKKQLRHEPCSSVP